jgi:hypothetical protein
VIEALFWMALDFFRPSLFTPQGARLRRFTAWWVVAGAGVIFIGVLM